MKPDHFWAIFVVVVAVSVSLPAFAEDNKNPCLPDVEKFCKGIPAAGGRAMKCLNDHEAKLSGDCRKTLGLVNLEWEACRGDADKLCRGEAAQKNGMSKCLKANESKVTPACRNAMNPVQETLEKNHPCARDAQKFCNKIPPGEGHLMSCIKSHQGELSSSCRAAMLPTPDKKKK